MHHTTDLDSECGRVPAGPPTEVAAHALAPPENVHGPGRRRSGRANPADVYMDPGVPLEVRSRPRPLPTYGDPVQPSPLEDGRTAQATERRQHSGHAEDNGGLGHGSDGRRHHPHRLPVPAAGGTPFEYGGQRTIRSPCYLRCTTPRNTDPLRVHYGVILRRHPARHRTSLPRHRPPPREAGMAAVTACARTVCP